MYASYCLQSDLTFAPKKCRPPPDNEHTSSVIGVILFVSDGKTKRGTNRARAGRCSPRGFLDLLPSIATVARVHAHAQVRYHVVYVLCNLPIARNYKFRPTGSTGLYAVRHERSARAITRPELNDGGVFDFHKSSAEPFGNDISRRK